MLDSTDLRIIDELYKNSRMAMKELGEKVHLTGQATSSRLAKLEDSGVIEGYTIQVNQGKLGNSVHPFMNIYSKSPYHEPFLAFLDTQQQFIVNNFKISGDELLSSRMQISIKRGLGSIFSRLK